jgi:hypothetical protein
MTRDMRSKEQEKTKYAKLTLNNFIAVLFVPENITDIRDVVLGTVYGRRTVDTKSSDGFIS